MDSRREQYYWTKGKLVVTGKTHDELAIAMNRASGLCICDQCGKDYYAHPYASEARDRDNEPYLHVLCNGDIVKL